MNILYALPPAAIVCIGYVIRGAIQSANAAKERRDAEARQRWNG